MRQTWIQDRAAKLLLTSAIAVLPVVIIALPITGLAQGGGQGDQDSPRPGDMAFAGGQMVRGTVTATSADHLTVKTDAGEIYQVAISANTRFTKDRQPIKVADIKTGDGVGAMGVLDAPTKTVHAVFVAIVDAEQVKKARENLGKTYITGKITSIDMDALKLTVMRPDGVSQTIAVDEQTSFKRGGRGMAAMASGAGVIDTGPMTTRANGAGAGSGDGSGIRGGGESITFADVKVGDSIAGRGGFKNGTFVPTELGVMDRAAMGSRRHRGPAGAGGPDAGSTAANPAGPAAPSGAASKNPPAPVTPTAVPQ